MGDPKSYRVRIVWALALAAAVACLLVAALVITMQRSTTDRQVEATLASVEAALAAGIASDARMLAATLEALARDRDLRALYRAGDRDRLLSELGPLFEELRERFRITHFYLVDAQRRTFLRVHAPQRHGDLLERFTLLEAAEFRRPASGVELGPYGTFTLRVVRPWLVDGDLIGFLELGQEIGHVIDDVQRITGAQLFALIDKQHLDREAWERGMRMLGRDPDWDRNPYYVLAGSSVGRDDTLRRRLFEAPESLEVGAPHDNLQAAGRFYHLHASELEDAGGRRVGYIVAAQDVTALEQRIRIVTLVVALAMVVLSGLFLVIFDRYLRRLELRLDVTRRARDRFQDLSRKDPLTSLLNRNELMFLLASELERARRFGNAVALLMLDLDYFKQVNDRYGHPMGDRVLKALSVVIANAVRPFDQLARYGGEEFVLLAPQTDATQAARIGVRICEAVAAAGFRSGRGEEFRVTVSVGVAVFPEDGDTPSSLLDAADRALYGAKSRGRGCVVRHGEPGSVGTDPGP